jgi:protein-tyrosine-phosphatase
MRIRLRHDWVRLTQEEREVVRDVILLHLQGQAIAKAEHTTDPNLGSAEDLVQIASDIDNECELLTKVLDRL